MKTYTKIPVIRADQTDQSLYRELCEVYPEGEERKAFRMSLPVEDPRAQRILELLRTHGMRPWEGFTSGSPEEFDLAYERVYDKRDFEQAAFLSPLPRDTFSVSHRRTPTGTLRVEVDEAKPKGQIVGTWGDALFVSADLRKQILEAKLGGVEVRPVEFMGRSGKPLAWDFWELTSSVTLPPLSPRNVFFAAAGNERQRVTAEYTSSYVLREGMHSPDILYGLPELHYAASELLNLSPFDLALTYERFGTDRPHLIASQGFYRFCVEHKLRMNWVPVRLDSEGEMQ